MDFDILLQHWGFFAFAALAAVVMQVLKNTLWATSQVKLAGKWGWVFWWGRKTLPLHPVVLGFFVGLMPGMPHGSLEGASPWPVALYYALAGLTSTWLFNVIKGIAKQKGIDLEDVVSAEEAEPPPAVIEKPAGPTGKG